MAEASSLPGEDALLYTKPGGGRSPNKPLWTPSNTFRSLQKVCAAQPEGRGLVRVLTEASQHHVLLSWRSSPKHICLDVATWTLHLTRYLTFKDT